MQSIQTQIWKTARYKQVCHPAWTCKIKNPTWCFSLILLQHCEENSTSMKQFTWIINLFLEHRSLWRFLFLQHWQKKTIYVFLFLQHIVNTCCNAINFPADLCFNFSWKKKQVLLRKNKYVATVIFSESWQFIMDYENFAWQGL